MRDAVGSTWIFSLVITFTLIFSGFLVLSLSYSKAYKIKNEMTSMIEKYEGLTTNDTLNHKGSIEIINQYLLNAGYSSMGKCPINSLATDDLTSDTLITINNTNNTNKYYYCVQINTNNLCHTTFKITVFFDFNLPVLGQLQKYNITGQTNEISNAYLRNKKIAC